MSSAQLDIPQALLDTTHLTLDDLRQELALTLYAQGRLSVSKAHEFAGLSLWEFRQRLAVRRIPPHYDLAELAEDLDAFTHSDAV